MSSTEPSSPFKLIQHRKDEVSDHPKTKQNREAVLQKRSLELAEHRDKAAFRTKKYRALKRLRSTIE